MSHCVARRRFGEGVKILHFIGQLKPWLVNFDSTTRQASSPEGFGHLAKYLQLWWDIFCTEIHPKLSTDMVSLAIFTTNNSVCVCATREFNFPN